MKYQTRLSLCVAVGFAIAALAQADRPLSVILVGNYWMQYNVKVFYAGDASPFYNANLMGGASINFGSTQNRRFFVRVYTYPCSDNGWVGRTDQSVSFVFQNPSQQGILYVYPGQNWLGAWGANLQPG